MTSGDECIEEMIVQVTWLRQTIPKNRDETFAWAEIPSYFKGGYQPFDDEIFNLVIMMRSTRNYPQRPRMLMCLNAKQNK